MTSCTTRRSGTRFTPNTRSGCHSRAWSGADVCQALYEPAVIPSFEEAKKRQLAIAHNFSLNLVPGKYLMRFEVRDTQDAGSWTETLTVRDLSPSPSISDLVIGDNLTKTPAGVVSVLPRPSRTFGPGGPREMFVYLDGYGFTGDSQPYEVSTEIVNDSGRVVKSLPPEHKKKTAPNDSRSLRRYQAGVCNRAPTLCG